mgnify:CR=1 FL=1
MNNRQVFDKHVPDKESFYELLIRRRFFMPHIKCNIITVRLMDQVYTGKIFMPNINQVHPITIAKPPSRKELQQELVLVLSSMNSDQAGTNLIEELKKKEADMQWITSMLFMVCPEHYVFDFSYSRLNKK